MKRTRVIAFATAWLLILLSLPLPAASNEQFGLGPTWVFWSHKIFKEPLPLLGLGRAMKVGAALQALPLLFASALLLWTVPAMLLSIRRNRPVGPRGLPLLLLLVWATRFIGYERASLTSGYYFLAAGFTVLTAALLLPDTGLDTPERRGFPVPPLLVPASPPPRPGEPTRSSLHDPR